MPARPRVSVMSAITPGRLGTATRSSLVAPGPSPASTSVRRRVAASSCQPVRSAPARSCARTVSSSAIAPSSASASASRLARRWRPTARGWRPRRASRRGSSGPWPAGVAAERVERPAHEDVGHHVRQVAHGGHHAVMELGVDDGGRAPRPVRAGAGARAACPGSSRSGSGTRSRRRRDPRARARRPPPPSPPVDGRRRSADRRRVEDRALGRADVGDDAPARRLRQDRGHRSASTSTGTGRRPRRRRRGRRPGRGGPCGSRRGRRPRRRGDRTRAPSRRAASGRPARPTRR